MFEAGALGQLELEAGELGQLELESDALGASLCLRLVHSAS